MIRAAAFRSTFLRLPWVRHGACVDSTSASAGDFASPGASWRPLRLLPLAVEAGLATDLGLTWDGLATDLRADLAVALAAFGLRLAGRSLCGCLFAEPLRPLSLAPSTLLFWSRCFSARLPDASRVWPWRLCAAPRLPSCWPAGGARVEQRQRLFQRDRLRRHVGGQRGVDAVVADIGTIAAVLHHHRAALVGMLAERAAGIGAEAAFAADPWPSSRRSASLRD